MNYNLFEQMTDAIREPILASKIMIVDDNHDNLLLLKSILEKKGYQNISSFSDSSVALDEFTSNPPNLLILDLQMPGISGFDFLKEAVLSIAPNTLVPILVYTADLTVEAKIKALQLGASEFLTKPCDAIEIQLRVTNFLRMVNMHEALQWYTQTLKQRVAERTAHLELARKEAVELLSKAAEYRDDQTGQHTVRVGDMSARLAQHIGCDEEFVESLRLVAPLHDVGKIAVPDSILRKPASLTPEEYNLMKTHSTVGGDLLAASESPLMQMATEIARYHHERWDGKGYPEGLKGNNIPVAARIVCVADAFDALTNDRPYRSAKSLEEAIDEITLHSGTQFDPTIVQALINLHLGTLSGVEVPYS